MNDLSKTIGDNQRRLRGEAGLSLDALARSSGVSKSRLSQIERGEANPSIVTLWQIAKALRVEFSALVTAEEDGSRVVSKRDVEPVTADERRCRTYPLFPFDPGVDFEFYCSEIDPGGRLASEPHPPGTQETIMVMTGRLSLTAGDETHALGPGDGLRFRADQPHSYANDGDGLVEFTMIVAYPHKG